MPHLDLSPRERIIVALDVPTLDEAMRAVDELSEHVGCFKVGLELLTAEGSRQVVDRIHANGGRIFYDAKFHDIPNTVAMASRSVSALGVWGFTVHAANGPRGLQEIAHHKGGSMAFGVTVLTSVDETTSQALYGKKPAEKVMEFATMAAEAGLEGVVCSPRELKAIRADEKTRELRTIVPGIRPAWASTNDQARIATPASAVRDGATYLVIGRPIMRPPGTTGSRADAARLIAEELASV